MKKLITILAAATMLFAACSKKQNAKPALTPQNATAKDLTGHWVLVADTSVTTTNGKSVATVTNDSSISFTFNADGTGAENLSTVTYFTYTVSDGLILLHAPASGNSPAADATLTIAAITATGLTLKAGNSDEMQTLVFVKN